MLLAYSWRGEIRVVLPPTFEATIFESRLLQIEPDMRYLLSCLYCRDKTSTVPRYVLVEDHELDYISCQAVIGWISSTFDGVQFDADRYPYLRIGQSVAEWKLRHAVATRNLNHDKDFSNTLNFCILVIRPVQLHPIEYSGLQQVSRYHLFQSSGSMHLS